MSYRNRKLSSDQIKEIKQFMRFKKHSAKDVLRALSVLLINRNDVDLLDELTGYSKSHAFSLRKNYLMYGISALETKKRKVEKLLTKNQLNEITNILQTETPISFGYDAPFWTTAILGHLIEEQYGVKYKSKTTIYIIFKRAKFTYHKPGQVYKNRNQEIVDAWQKETGPLILKHLKDDQTEVFTADEMILSTVTTFQKIWLPEGRYPKVEISNTRKNRSSYGFLNIKTGKQYAFKTEKQNSEITCKILDQLCSKYSHKKIVILWDNAPWHRGEKVKEFLRNTKHSLMLINFPPYAPENNPQEHVWKEGRSQITHNLFIENIDKAADEFVNFLNNTIFKYKLLGVSPALEC